MAAFLRRQKLVIIVVVLLCVVVYFSIHLKVWVPEERFAKPGHLNNSKYPSPKLLPCKWVPETLLRQTRSQCYLNCAKTRGQRSKGNTTTTHGSSQRPLPSVFSCKEVTEDTPVPSLPPENPTCLKNFIQNYCYGAGHTIPRVAHYVRFGAYNLTLDAFLGMYSVARFLQPCVILFHGDAIPSGRYWRALLHLLPNIVHVPRVRPLEIFGNPINVVQHSSDVTRLRILLELGGIYLDFDELLLNPLDDLFNKSTVLGHESKGKSINNALIVTKPDSKFLRIWLDRYTTFKDRQWSVHSTELPRKLAQNYSDLVDVVDTFFGPVHPSNRRFYDTRRRKRLNWPKYYGMHLYARLNQRHFYGGERIDKQNHVIGDVIRYIMYGDKQACMEH